MNLVIQSLPVQFEAAVQKNDKPPERAEETAAEKIQDLFLRNKFQETGRLLGTQSQEQLREIQVRLANKCAPVGQALLAAEHMMQCDDPLAISPGKMAQIAFFIETQLATKIAKKEYRIPSEETLSHVAIEYDPQSKNTFIYSENSADDRLGSGFQKVVSKAILYDAVTPRIVALCRAKTTRQSEIQYIQAMQPNRGIARLHTIIQRPEEEIPLLFFFDRYNAGSLGSIFKRRTYSFTMPEKGKIALDLLYGLQAMHERNLMHADLHSGNLLVQVTKKPGQKRDVAAVLCDFGRTCLKNEKEKSEYPQAAPRFRGPECYFTDLLQPADYEYTDIFALGCNLYQLFYDKEPAWWQKGPISFSSDKKNEQQVLMQAISTAIRPRKRALSGWCGFGRTLSGEERFEALVLRMIDPVPQSRGTLLELVQEMTQICALLAG